MIPPRPTREPPLPNYISQMTEDATRAKVAARFRDKNIASLRKVCHQGSQLGVIAARMKWCQRDGMTRKEVWSISLHPEMEGSVGDYVCRLRCSKIREHLNSPKVDYIRHHIKAALVAGVDEADIIREVPEASYQVEWVLAKWKIQLPPS